MRSLNSCRYLSAFFLTLAVCAAAVTASAQIDESGGGRRPRTRVRIQKVVKVVKVPEVRYQKISGVAITTVQPNADVSFKAANGGRYRQAKKTDADGVLNFVNVPPGKYSLTVSLDGYVTEESEVEVAPQQLVTVPVNLAPITHDIFIKTNVTRGEVRYAKMQKAAGQGVRGLSGYCMVPIENGTAEIPRLQEGDYRIEVRPGDVEYKPVSRELTISDEALAKFESTDGRNEVPVTLTRTTSTEDFLANWLPNEWRMPAGWKIESKRMQVNSAGVALLQNERFNYYRDFELRTGVRSLDNTTVGFVLRAADPENYYLIQMTGSAAAQPYFLTGYIVKDGKVAETLAPVSIRSYAKSFSDRKHFNLIITATGNVFRVRLEDTETGQSFIIGIIEDQNSTYPIGALGVGIKDDGRFEVTNFHIKFN